MKKLSLILAIVMAWTVSVFATEVPVITPLLINGPSKNRVNIVFLSEAYTSSQLGTYLTDVNIAVEELFKRSPFMEYKKFFNVYVVWVASKDSIVSIVGKNEELRTYFGERRSLDYSIEKISSVAKSFFAKLDPVVCVLLINDGQFGADSSQPQILSVIGISALGSGLMRNKDNARPYDKDVYASSTAIELGHSFAGLRDEHASEADPALKPGKTESDFGSKFDFTNVTTQTNPNLIKWKYWIDPSTPIPTPNTPEFADVVGLFEGAYDFSRGWYRPQLKCTMATYHPDVEPRPAFCKVCREAITKSIYKYVNPTSELVSDVGENTTMFSINPPEPTDHSLNVRWLVDGKVAATNVTSFPATDTEIGYGRHRLRVEVVDSTSFVRYDPDKLLVNSKEWDVISIPLPDFSGDGVVDFDDFFEFADNFGKEASTVEVQQYDLNWDGKIDFFDFFLFADSFGKRVSENKISVKSAQ